MRTRSALLSDLETVCAIARAQPRSAGWTLEQFRQELSFIGGFFLVLEDEAVRAYAVFKRLDAQAQLVDLAVDPRFLRRGLARTLLRDSLPALKSRGVERIQLEVSQGNEPARRLYESLGFVIVGRRRKFYNDGSDAILMDLPLA